MNLTEHQLQIIHKETLRCYPNEAVICITKDDAIPLDNIHEDPRHYFQVESKSFYKNKGIALVHSHPTILGEVNPRFGPEYVDARVPSSGDMRSQINMNVPFGIITTDGTEVSPILWFPDLDSPLEGHEYLHGVYDCWRLVRAYYWQNYNILLEDYARDYDWWKTNPNLYVEQIYSRGFYDIDEDQLEVGDILIIRLFGTAESHSAVYLGNNQMIHHMNNRLPSVDNFAKWRRKITRILRHKDKPCKN